MDRKRKIKRKLESSLIIGCLNRFSGYIYKKLTNGFFGGLFSDYKKSERLAKKSLLARSMKKLPLVQKTMRPIKQALARSVEESRLINYLMNALDRLRLCTLRVYATFFLSFGLYTLLVFLLKKYAVGTGESSLIHLTAGFALILMSIPLFFSGKTLSEGIMSGTIPRTFLISVAGLRPEIIEKDGQQGGRKNIAFIFGMFFGAMTFFVSPIYIIGAMLSLIIAYIILLSPEFGIVFALFITPFLVFLSSPTILLCAAVLYITLCYIIKLVRGKRVLKVDLLDVFIALFAAVFLLGGAISIGGKASLMTAAVYVCLMLGYFLIVNLINTAKWLRRSVISLVSSALLVSLWGIVQQFTGTLENIWIDKQMFSDISVRVTSAFENPNMLAEYLIIVFPFALALLLLSDSLKTAGVRFAVCCAMLACIVLTWSRGAWLGLICGLFLFFLIYNKKTVTALVLGVFAIPFVPFVLPANIWQRLSSIGNLADSSTNYRVNIWRGATRLAGDYFTSGIGVGESAFNMIYPQYRLAGIVAPHSHNLYLQLLVELGVLGLLLFIAVIFLFMQSSFGHFGTTQNKDSRLMAAAAFSGVTAALAQGFTDYIWYNYRVFFIFWAVIGLAAAFRRCEAANLNVMSYKCKKDDHSANIDIPIRNKL